MSSPCAELGVVGRRKHLKETFLTLDLKFPSQHRNVVYFRTRLRVGIIQNEQICPDFLQRLSEPFLLRHAGHTEHPDWKYFLKMSRKKDQLSCAKKNNHFQTSP